MKICNFCNTTIDQEAEWTLYGKQGEVKEFCCLGCLSGAVDELAIEAEEQSPHGLIN